jgi:hypothetical protein
MKKELQEKVFNEFPEICRGSKLSSREHCLGRGIETDDGWFPIIYAMSKAVDVHLKKLKDAGKPLDFEFTQIKEKFATLRVYDNGGDEFIDGVIATAEILSSITCEVCGRTGYRSVNERGSWVKTLCEEHAQELSYKKIKQADENL